MKRSEYLFVATVNLVLASLFIGAFPIRPVQAEAPYLIFVKEYYYCPLIASNPYGKLNLIVDISKVMYDGSPDYDWYFYSNIPVGAQGIRLQSVPGRVAYNSNWETAHIWAKHTVYSPGTYRWLVDYDPTTTNGWNSATATASVTISPEGGGAGFSQSYTYSIPYVNVLDYSDFAEHRAYWQHNFNTQGDPAGAPSETTYLARPAFVVKTTQNAWTLVDGWYEISFGHPVWFWWEYITFTIYPYYLDAQKSGTP